MLPESQTKTFGEHGYSMGYFEGAAKIIFMEMRWGANSGNQYSDLGWPLNETAVSIYFLAGAAGLGAGVVTRPRVEGWVS